MQIRAGRHRQVSLSGKLVTCTGFCCRPEGSKCQRCLQPCSCSRVAMGRGSSHSPGKSLSQLHFISSASVRVQTQDIGQHPLPQAPLGRDISPEVQAPLASKFQFSTPELNRK